MKARLVRFGCFVLTVPPQKKKLLLRRSDLFYFATTCCVSERREKGYKSSTVRLSSLGKIVDQCNSWRRRNRGKEFTMGAGTFKVCIVQSGWKILENV